MTTLQQPNIESLLAADDARYAALHRGDVAALEGIFTDDFTYTHNTGFIESKRDYIEMIRSGAVRFSAGGRVAADATIHGSTGIIRGQMKMTAHLTDETVQLDNLFLALWVFVAGQWRCAAWASTKRKS